MLAGDLPDAESAQFDVLPGEGYSEDIGGIAMVFLLLRAFSSVRRLTGVEAISNGVPAFKPKGKNAAATLVLLGASGITMAMSILILANIMDVGVVEDPGAQLVTEDGEPVGEGITRTP